MNMRSQHRQQAAQFLDVRPYYDPLRVLRFFFALSVTRNNFLLQRSSLRRSRLAQRLVLVWRRWMTIGGMVSAWSAGRNAAPGSCHSRSAPSDDDRAARVGIVDARRCSAEGGPANQGRRFAASPWQTAAEAARRMSRGAARATIAAVLIAGGSSTRLVERLRARQVRPPADPGKTASRR